MNIRERLEALANEWEKGTHIPRHIKELRSILAEFPDEGRDGDIEIDISDDKWHDLPTGVFRE